MKLTRRRVGKGALSRAVPTGLAEVGTLRFAHPTYYIRTYLIRSQRNLLQPCETEEIP